MIGPVQVVLATRNPGKVREIRDILAGFSSVEITGLDALGVAETADEDLLEVFETFEENALAKARHFAALTRRLVLADDSGICVDALGGAPGVRSRRFAAAEELRGEAQDAANNRHLLSLLAEKPAAERTAHYVCAAALAWPDGREALFTGTCDGIVLDEPRGTGGFGYDPLFFMSEEGCTFGELPPARKNEVSHRGRAVRKAVEKLLRG